VKAGRQLRPSWRPPLESGEGADHDQEALTAGRTGLPRAEG
jgi:hypothetical protein